MTESYDYYECAVCKKIKPVGGEVVRKIAYNRFNSKAQDETKQEAQLAAYYALVCPECDALAKLEVKEKLMLDKISDKKE